MFEYAIDAVLISSPQAGSKKTVTIYTPQEWQNSSAPKKLLKLASIKYNVCRFELTEDMIFVALMVPDRGSHTEKREIKFFLFQNSAVFIDSSGLAREVIERMVKRRRKTEKSSVRFLYSFLQTLIEYDFEHLDKISQRISEIENNVLQGDSDGYLNDIITIRRELLTYHCYYNHLADISLRISNEETDIFCKQQFNLLKVFSERAERLCSIAKMLHEYSLQLGEINQTQTDVKLNRSMNAMTVISSIFLPLTLITGWYGMNFEHMPELKWTLGYPFVIALSVAVAAFSVYYIRKMKF